MPVYTDYAKANDALKINVPVKAEFPNVETLSAHTCGEFICFSGYDVEKLKFEFDKIRQVYSMQYDASVLVIQSHNHLVDAITHEQMSHAYTQYRAEVLQNENTRLMIKSTASKWFERIIFALTLGIGAYVGGQ